MSFSNLIGKNVLLITDKGITGLKLYESLITNLRKLGVTINTFDDVEADPSLKTLERAISFGNENFVTNWFKYSKLVTIVSLLKNAQETVTEKKVKII